MTDPDLEGRLARIDAFELRLLEATEALTAVLEDPELGSTYQPVRDALLDALRWLEIECTCGDCIEGRCQFGGEGPRAPIAVAQAGVECVDPAHGECGCPRHKASVQARQRRARLVAAGILAVTDPYRRPPDCPDRSA